MTMLRIDQHSTSRRVTGALPIALALAAVWSAPARSAVDAGAIAIEGADISAGQGEPRGRTIVDGCAPPAPEAERLSRYCAWPPDSPKFDLGTAPALGAGTLDYVAAASTTSTLEAGPHDYASFTVEAGAVVDCAGPVTIRVRGDVSIQGELTSSADGASISIACGGAFAMGTGTGGAPSLSTAGLAAPVAVDASGAITVDAADARIGAAHGGVLLVQRFASAPLLLRGVTIESAEPAVTRSAGTLRLRDAVVRSSGSVTLRAFYGAIDAENAAIEAAGFLAASSGAAVSLTDASLSSGVWVEVLAVGGAAHLTRATIETSSDASRSMTVWSRDGTYMSGSAVRHRGAGPLNFESKADIALESSGDPAASFVVHEGAGDVRVNACGVISARGASVVSAAHGHVNVNADAIDARGDVRFAAPEGWIGISVDAAVRLGAEDGNPGLPDLAARAIAISAGRESSAVHVDRLDAGTGGFLFTAEAETSFRGTIASAGTISIQVQNGVIDLAGAEVSTTATSGVASAPIFVQTFFDGRIDATGARIRSGDAVGATSGDVLLLVRQPYYPSGDTSIDGDDGRLPARFEAVAIDARRVRVSWIPRELDATGYVLERSEGFGWFTALPTLDAGTAVFVDEGLAADTEYRYRVSVLSASLVSYPTQPVLVRTGSNVRVRVLRASWLDRRRRLRDRLELSLKLRFDDRTSGETVDPRQGPLRVTLGDAFFLEVPSDTPSWTFERGVYRWTGPAGNSGGTAILRFEPASGRLDISARGHAVLTHGADRSRVHVRIGADGGSKALRAKAR